jgi:hypothetical protein
MMTARQMLVLKVLKPFSIVALYDECSSYTCCRLLCSPSSLTHYCVFFYLRFTEVIFPSTCHGQLFNIVYWGAGILGVQPLDQRDVAENLLLHEGMVFDHLHTSYAALLNRNLISTHSI